MASISSVGLGSGLDVKSIVSQLVALEKRPLTALQTADASIQSKISTFSQIKSLVSTFADATALLTRDGGWNAMTTSSTNTAAVTATVSGVTTATSFSLEVQQLARSQSVGTASAPAATVYKTGTLSIQLGSWNQAGTAGSETMAFNPGANAAVSVTIGEGDTSLAAIAGKINDANAGVTATVLSDSAGQRLLLRSKTTGETTGFRIQATDNAGAPAASTGLAAFGFDIEGQSAASVAAQSTVQLGQNAKATINGVPISSATNTFADTVPGLSLQVAQVTTGPVGVGVSADTATTKKNLQAFVTAYNALNDLLSTSVKYDSDSKTAGPLQGDSTTVGIQNILRGVMGGSVPGGLFSTLSDIGIAVQRGGGLTVDTTKLDKALSTTDSAAAAKKLFAGSKASGSLADGIAVRLKSLTTSMLAYDGSLNAKSDALQAADKRNLAEQDKVNAHAAEVETRLNAQYTALDSRMATLSALSSYVTQQVTNWNKSTS